VFLHLALVWRMTFMSGGPASRGENGNEGGGGATFEVEIAGNESPDRPPLPGDVDSARSDEQASAPTITPPTARPMTRARPDRGAPAATDAPEVAVAPEAHPQPPTDPSVDGSGTGAVVTDEGRLRGRDDPRIRALLETSVGGALGGSSAGTIALLADAAHCPDPVEGTWTAYRYSPEFRDWARFTMRIRRNGDELRGTISTRMWRGLPSERHPPPCTPDGWDYTVEMRAEGRVIGDHFDFGAREHHVARVDCASSMFGYNPDHFRGTYDAEAERLDTVNNDGGRDVDAPYTFRRSSCEAH
jgi:hypothetical protein